MFIAVEAYLSERRQLGFEMRNEGQELRRFARYADSRPNPGPLTAELALQWAQLPAHADPLYLARRLDMVRRFAKYRVLTDPDTEVPPEGILGPSYRRPTPHIYTEVEIAALLRGALHVGRAGGLRSLTHYTLFGLLTCTGLRISEGLRMTDADVDFNANVLLVSKTKFHKCRLVPIHPSVSAKLSDYVQRRNQRLKIESAPRFFMTERGTPLKYLKTLMAFHKLRKELGWDKRCRVPRIHHLRHAFAVRTLLRWYQDGEDIGSKLPILSTYLGHVKVSDTYWYLTGVPELFALVSDRFSNYVHGCERQDVLLHEPTG
jgi:site-specific recombinase XerD